jgi:hypothetical protein
MSSDFAQGTAYAAPTEACNSTIWRYTRLEAQVTLGDWTDLTTCARDPLFGAHTFRADD